MRKIIVLPLYGIGDVLMTTPAIRNLKEQSDVEITYLHMFKTTRDILINNPYVDNNIHFPFLEAGKLSGLRFLKDLRNKYDVSINFYPSNRRQYNIAAFIVGSPVRIGHRYVCRDRMELNFLKNKTLKEDDNLHNVEENLRLLKFLGIQEAKPYPLEFYLTQEEVSFAQQWIQGYGIDESKLIGIHPGTSTFKNHEKKRWPDASFAKLIDRISAEVHNSIFLLFGGPEEESLRNKIISMVDNQKKVIAVNSVSVRQAASLLKKCLLFIGNDAGPMHMAAAVGVPTVAIFGPTNPVWLRPWGVKHKIVSLGLPCSPCFRYSPKPFQCIAKIDYACLREISVDYAFKLCMELLKEAEI
jgi:ADP-heptose:LPS heptosyltransferase